MSTKYYAIRVGAGVTNKIVTTWEECQLYVLGYPAVYKSFKSLEKAEEYLRLSTADLVKLQQEKKKIK